MDKFDNKTTLRALLALPGGIPINTRIAACYFVSAPQAGEGGGWWEAKIDGDETQRFLCLDLRATRELVPRLRGLRDGHRAYAGFVYALVRDGWAVPVRVNLLDEVPEDDSRLDEPALPVVDGPALVRLYSTGKVDFPKSVLL